MDEHWSIVRFSEGLYVFRAVNDVGFVASLYCHSIYNLYMADTSQDLIIVPPNSTHIYI